MKSAPFSAVIASLLVTTLACSAASVQRDIEYGVADGERLLLDACIPDGPGPHPAVILVHGGAWTRGDKNGGSSPGTPSRGYMAPLQEPLSSAGFAWFSINYRLVPKHPYPACIEDVETAIRWVKAHAAEYHLDPARIALSGESAGGHLVALAAVRADSSTRVAAVVPFYGSYNLTLDYEPNQSLSTEMTALFGKERIDDKTAALIRSASPVLLVKPGLPPFLLLHGTGDTRVPIIHSIEMEKRLKAAGVPCDFLRIPGAPHGMANWDKFSATYKTDVIAWLKKTLAIAPTPTPAAEKTAP